MDATISIKLYDIDKYLNNIYIIEDYKLIKQNKEVKNQLFRKKIEFNFLNNLIKKLFDIELLDNTNYNFSKTTLQKKNIIDLINNEVKKLEEIYIKCKHKLYLRNINEKKVITILRQLLRIHDYELKSKEKYENGKKFLMYTIFKKKEISNIKKINSIINFD